MLQFKFPAANSVRIPAGEACALHRSALLGCSAIFGYKNNDDLQDSARPTCPCGEGGDEHEEATSQLHKCVVENVIEN